MAEDNYTNQYPETQQDAENIAKHSVKVKQKERTIRKQRKKLNRVKTFLRVLVFAALLFFIYEFY